MRRKYLIVLGLMGLLGGCRGAGGGPSGGSYFADPSASPSTTARPDGAAGPGERPASRDGGPGTAGPDAGSQDSDAATPRDPSLPGEDAGDFVAPDAGDYGAPDAGSASEGDAGGPPTPDAPDASAPPPPRQAVELSLISYNVQARPVLDDARARVNLPIIGGLLGAYDVGGFAECFSQCDKLLAQAPQPYDYYFDDREHWWSLTNSGLAGVSRFEPTEVLKRHYQNQAEIADTVASKGVVLMRLDVGGFLVDVYNTHMQAGDSDAAHQAQSAQADELIAFIRASSPPEHSVLLHGDFNMGPARPGKAWDKFDPNHYSNEADMLVRTASFSRVMTELALTDVSDALFGPTRDHIDRVLYRAARDATLTPLEWRDDAARFVDSSGQALSDSMPLVVKLRFESAP